MDEHRSKRLKSSSNEDDQNSTNNDELNLSTNSQQNDLMLLKYDIRDLIISSLNQATAFLNGREIENVLKEKVIKDKNYLILKLISLQRTSDDNILNNILNNTTRSELIYKIERKLIVKIIDNLMQHNYETNKFNTITNETKMNLLDENKNLIIELLDLKAELIKAELNSTNSQDASIVKREIIGEGNFFLLK